MVCHSCSRTSGTFSAFREGGFEKVLGFVSGLEGVLMDFAFSALVAGLGKGGGW